MSKIGFYVEHANICVEKPEDTIKFLMSAIPAWKIRGNGEMDWFGERANWFHVGDDNSYIAIQSGASGPSGNWKDLWAGVKHIGIVVENVSQVVSRLESSGYHVDHYGADHPYRRNVYFLDDNNVQFEFIEYLTDVPVLKNQY